MPKDTWLWVRLGNIFSMSSACGTQKTSGILGYIGARAAHWQLQAVRKATTITVREKHKDPIGLHSADGEATIYLCIVDIG